MKPLSKAPSAGDTDWSRQPERSNATLLRIMTTAPAWAQGLPLNAEVAVMTRYGK